METIKGVKGFDKNLKCRDFQYKEGETFTTDQIPVRCTENGFHFCENPLDVFGYYPPADSVFHEVEGSGQVSRDDDSDSKVAVSQIKIGAQVNLMGVVKAGVEYILKRIDWNNNKESNTGDQSAATNTGDQSAATNTGYRSAATNTGDQSAATNTGDRSAATNTGDQSAASVEGKESVAMAIGYRSTAKGALGCWIVLAEWVEKSDGYHIKAVKSVRVDGKRIKADTFYRLEGGKFIKNE